MSALQELRENRENLTLRERVELRRRIDAEDGIVYPPPNMYQVAALSRLLRPPNKHQVAALSRLRASVAGGTGAGHGSVRGRALPTN